jgi:hypothetical protein
MKAYFIKPLTNRTVTPGQSGLSLFTLILILALLLTIALAYQVLWQQQPEKKSAPEAQIPLSASRQNLNRLATGNLAKEEEVDIELHPVKELDFMTKADVLNLRKNAVYKYPELIEGNYLPSGAIFGRIEDGRPWWGIHGVSYGRGDKSIEGPSEQSISILNPYLLAVPQFYLVWNLAIVPEADLGSARFPVQCDPYDLKWYPGLGRAEISYNAGCAGLSHGSAFSLIVYNARDFNLNYVYVSYDNSSNISKDNPPDKPYPISHFLHRGGSCGYPGGCNNISPSTPFIDDIRITGRPARAVIWFWRDKPGSAEEQPDMEFVIYFK